MCYDSLEDTVKYGLSHHHVLIFSHVKLDNKRPICAHISVMVIWTILSVIIVGISARSMLWNVWDFVSYQLNTQQLKFFVSQTDAFLFIQKNLICRKYHTHKRSAIDTDKVFTPSCKITRTYQFYLWRSTTTMQITCERSKHK